jgi:hypothetical protein
MLEVHDLANSLCLNPIGIGAMAATKVQYMLPLFPKQHKEPSKVDAEVRMSDLLPYRRFCIYYGYTLIPED